MKYIRTKDGIIDVKSVEERLLNEVKDLIKLKIYDLDDDDEDGEEEIEAELKSIKVISTMETGKIVISCESETQDLYEEYDVVKMSDSIEELCDGFVVYREGEGKLIFDGTHRFYKVYAKKSVFESAMEEYNDFKDSGEEIWVKGFIWTDEGLIYVAKMNEKGELELL